MTQDQSAQKTAAKDIGYFWVLFSAVVGAPSLLVILESVFVQHRLVEALQWIPDGWNGVTAVLGAIVEPLAKPLIDALNEQFSLDLTLDPLWRPLFALYLTTLTSFIRGLPRDREDSALKDFGTRIAVFLLMGFFGLFAVLGAGLRSSWSSWDVVGMIACMTALGLFFALTPLRRVGLLMVGGIVAAGIILTADFVVKAFGVS